MQKEDIGFVFVHGAGLGGWIWDDVVKQLHTSSVAADFPKRGEPKETRKDLHLSDYVSEVLQQISALQTDKIVVVGHSLGGVVALEVAHQLGNKLVGFVGISAAIPEKPGQSFLHVLPFPARLIMQSTLRLVGTQPPDAAIEKALSDSLDKAQISKIIQRYNAESFHIYADKMTAPLPQVPSLYIRTTHDKEFSASLQDKMAHRLMDVKVTDLPAGHMPMLSHPSEIAAILRKWC